MGEGFFGKVKNLIGIEEIEEEEVVEVEEQESPKAPVQERTVIEPRSFVQQRKEQETKEMKEDKDQRATGAVSRVTSQFKMIVIEPKSFDECPKLVDSLKARKPIIINLERVESDTARKIFDFLSGATYALAGNVQKVANNIFLFAPENVDVTAQTEQQRSGGFNDSIKNPWR